MMLVNARDVKTVPGRKSDVSDAAWLADLGVYGLVEFLVRATGTDSCAARSTRARTMITQERTREIQRLEKLLENTGIKLSSVAADIIGVSGRLMLEALIDGRDEPVQHSQLAKGRLRSKIPVLTEALTGYFTPHPAFMTRLFLDRIDAHTPDIDKLSARIDEAMAPFRPARDLLISIPGFSGDRRRDIHRRARR